MNTNVRFFYVLSRSIFKGANYKFLMVLIVFNSSIRITSSSLNSLSYVLFTRDLVC